MAGITFRTLTNNMGHFGNIFLIIGSFMIGEKVPQAFLLIFLGELFWLSRGLLTKQLDVIIICVVFAVLALVNYYKFGGRFGIS